MRADLTEHIAEDGVLEPASVEDDPIAGSCTHRCAMG
jgi:hypothetical protein